MDLLEFFTGHSSDEASVYENQDKVDSVVSKLTDLGSKSIPTMTQTITDAVAKYNSVNGVGTYVSDLDPGYFTSMMDEIGSGVTTISTNISGAADDIKAYNEANIFEKIGSSVAMLGCKVGEGFLSVFEGLGDAVVSVAGWIAPKGSDFEKACEDFVKDQWSHDLFNFYYNSDFAKKSAFTEDSAIAGVGKLAGTVAAFVVPGMAFSAVAGAIGEGASAAVGIANTIANSSKIINVVSAGMMGMGSATEAGLLAGKSMDDAALAGAGAGALSAGLAFGISTVAEKLGSVIGKGAGAADDVLNQTDDVIAQNADDVANGTQKLLTGEERLALPGALEDGTPVGKGLAGKGSGELLLGESSVATTELPGKGASGLLESAANQTDDIVSQHADDVIYLGGKERLALPGELADGTPVGKGAFKSRVFAERPADLEKLSTLVSDETKSAYTSALQDGFSTRSQVELLANKAVSSGDYAANQEVKELVDKVVTDNVAEYLGGTDSELSTKISQYITDNNLVERAVSEYGSAAQPTSAQNYLEQKLTSYLISNSDDVTRDRLVQNIVQSVDNKGVNMDYSHIITYDTSAGQMGGYHKLGAPEFIGDESLPLTTKHVGFADKPFKTNITDMSGELYLDPDTGAAVTKNLFPNEYTHQQIVDLASDVVKTGEVAENTTHGGWLHTKTIELGGKKCKVTVATTDDKSFIKTIMLGFNQTKGQAKAMERVFTVVK